MTHEQVLAEHLRAIWPTFGRAGVDRFVLARYLPGRAEVDSLRNALSGVELLVVALSAPRDVLEERLRRRDTGAQLAEHLEAVCAADALVESGGTAESRAMGVRRARSRWRSRSAQGGVNSPGPDPGLFTSGSRCGTNPPKRSQERLRSAPSTRRSYR